MVNNLSIPTSDLNKIHEVIFDHCVREAHAAEIIWVGWMEGIRNLAGFSTKTKKYIPTIQGVISKISNNSVSVVTSDRG